MSEPLLDETKTAEALARMNDVYINLKSIVDKLGDVFNTFVPNDKETKQKVNDVLVLFKQANEEFNFKDFFKVLKTFSSKQLDEVKNGVSELFSNNNISVSVNNDNNTVTIRSTKIGVQTLNAKDLVIDEVCSPMHMRNGGSRRRKQYGGIDPVSIFALGLAGTTGTAIGIIIMIALSFIYLGLCLLLYSGALNDMGFITGILWIGYGPVCIPVGLLLFLNKIRKTIQESCSSNRGGKLKTARKRILINKKRKTIAKKSKKLRR
jgi:hypothetical protein